jgi:hypothetical protein
MSTMTLTETAPTRPAPPEEIELQSTHHSGNLDTDTDGAVDGSTTLTRTNLLRVIAASLTFFLAGNNDGSLGALTPYILRTYSVGTQYVALM